MKKILILSLLALLLISGCAKKKPRPLNSNGGYDNSDIATDIVTIDEGLGSTSASNPNGFNSSTDGMQSIYFDFGGYTITPQMQDVLSLNRNIISQKLRGGKVKLEGNCDEFGTDEYNQALGLKRTKAVKDNLVSLGIPQHQIVVVSYGESNPQCHEATDECYARNRRVDLGLIR
jgi:peptidoglycan-associated lipoprotein